MNSVDWILFKNENRRFFDKSTWVPLRASQTTEIGNIKEIGFKTEYFGCGSVTFPEDQLDIAEQLSWGEIGIGCETNPYAYDDGHYSSIEQYEYPDREPIGIHLVFSYSHPVVYKREWILNPDIVVALGLIKEGKSWVRPEENFVEVVREVLDNKGNHILIEIKREFLIDYLAARNLALRLSYYRQRVENVKALENSDYIALENKK